MILRIYQVDAFASRVFGGNPAAVVPLQHWLADPTLQAIATENNLPETAFFVPRVGHYHLRWFTPTSEVPLCGHATLAAAYVILTRLAPELNAVWFDTLSGRLDVQREGGFFTLALPKYVPVPCQAPALLVEGLGPSPREVLFVDRDPNYYAVYDSEQEIRLLSPNFSLLEQLHPYGVAVTAVGTDVDFVSRYFAPSYGIREDPVTGSTHCALSPYWSSRLGKSRLQARQISQRGGEIVGEALADSVRVAGQAALYLEGDIHV